MPNEQIYLTIALISSIVVILNLGVAAFFIYRKQRELIDSLQKEITESQPEESDLAFDHDELQEFYESLKFKKAGVEYTKADRFKDFKDVFYTTDSGKRVLAQILHEANGVLILENEVEGHGRLAYRAGKDYMAQWIVKILNVQPLIDN